MSFIDAFKRLEKLCNEIYGDIHGVKIYINEMSNTPDGEHYVVGWNDDLKMLKHLNWVRNKISHDPECNEDNMCEPGDAEWINRFHSRIMATNDPLTQYHKAKNIKPTPNLQQTFSSEPRNYAYPKRRSTLQKSAGCLTYIVSVLLIVAAVVSIVSVI